MVAQGDAQTEPPPVRGHQVVLRPATRIAEARQDPPGRAGTGGRGQPTFGEQPAQVVPRVALVGEHGPHREDLGYTLVVVDPGAQRGPRLRRPDGPQRVPRLHHGHMVRAVLPHLDQVRHRGLVPQPPQFADLVVHVPGHLPCRCGADVVVGLLLLARERGPLVPSVRRPAPRPARPVRADRTAARILAPASSSVSPPPGSLVRAIR